MILPVCCKSVADSLAKPGAKVNYDQAQKQCSLGVKIKLAYGLKAFLRLAGFDSLIRSCRGDGWFFSAHYCTATAHCRDRTALFSMASA